VKRVYIIIGNCMCMDLMLTKMLRMEQKVHGENGELLML